MIAELNGIDGAMPSNFPSSIFYSSRTYFIW
jgi:hypothetical protein